MSRRPGGPLHLAVYTEAPVRGGAEVNLSRVLAALPSGFRVTLVGVDADVLSWLAGHRPGTDTVQLAPIADRWDVADMLAHRRAFARLRPDILQFNLAEASSCQWAVLASCAVPGLRRVVVENSPIGVRSGISGRLKRFTAPRLAAHVAVGDRSARMIEESAGLRPGSIATLYHGLPDVGREPVDRPDGPTLLAVARHDRVKGLDVLLSAMELVPPPTRLVVIGDGPESGRLRDQARDLGLEDRVEFRDVSWDRRVADLMWAFDGLVLPSRVEGLPVTILEAMLAGLPVVATGVGSVEEAVVDGVTGWVVPREDPAALAAAIGDLVRDLPAARAMGERGREVALGRFTIEATAEAYVELYRSVLGPTAWAGRQIW